MTDRLGMKGKSPITGGRECFNIGTITQNKREPLVGKRQRLSGYINEKRINGLKAAERSRSKR